MYFPLYSDNIVLLWTPRLILNNLQLKILQQDYYKQVNGRTFQVNFEVKLKLQIKMGGSES